MSQFKMKTCGLSGTIARTLLCGVAAQLRFLLVLTPMLPLKRAARSRLSAQPTLTGLIPPGRSGYHQQLSAPDQRTLISYDSSTDETVRITPVGDLATEVPQPSADGLSYTFTIRDGATWNTPDGARQISSEDVERGIKTHVQSGAWVFCPDLLHLAHRGDGQLLRRLLQGRPDCRRHEGLYSGK